MAATRRMESPPLPAKWSVSVLTFVSLLSVVLPTIVVGRWDEQTSVRRPSRSGASRSDYPPRTMTLVRFGAKKPPAAVVNAMVVRDANCR